MLLDYLPALLGFFAGLCFGLMVALALCIWWLRTLHQAIYETPEEVSLPAAAEPEEPSADGTVIEEEPGEWWKRS